MTHYLKSINIVLSIYHFPELKNWVLLIDYNQDSKVDILHALTYHLQYIYKTSESNCHLISKFFTQMQDLTTTLYVDRDDIPAIADIDGDSDFDILTFSPNGVTYIFMKTNQCKWRK